MKAAVLRAQNQPMEIEEVQISKDDNDQVQERRRRIGYAKLTKRHLFFKTYADEDANNNGQHLEEQRD